MNRKQLLHLVADLTTIFRIYEENIYTNAMKNKTKWTAEQDPIQKSPFISHYLFLFLKMLNQTFSILSSREQPIFVLYSFGFQNPVILFKHEKNMFQFESLFLEIRVQILKLKLQAKTQINSTNKLNSSKNSTKIT